MTLTTNEVHRVHTSTVDVEGDTDKLDAKANVAARAIVTVYSILTGLVASCFLSTVDFLLLSSLTHC